MNVMGKAHKLKVVGWKGKYQRAGGWRKSGDWLKAELASSTLSQLSEFQCFFVSVSVTEDQIPHGFPTIDMGPQLKVVERTRTATMLCAASGNPDPEIFWFKDFLPVDISSTNGRIKQLRSGKASSLHLHTQISEPVLHIQVMISEITNE